MMQKLVSSTTDFIIVFPNLTTKTVASWLPLYHSSSWTSILRP